MKRFIECLVPDSFCNFKCSYCYVQQQARKSKKRIYTQYSPSYIAKALSPDRLGGVSYKYYWVGRNINPRKSCSDCA